MNGLEMKGILIGLVIGGAGWIVISVASAFVLGALIAAGKKEAK